MRAALTSIVALMLGCVYEPVEIAVFDEDTSFDPSYGLYVVDWTEAQLRDGVVLLVDLGILEVEIVALGEGTHHVVIEVLPIVPATLPTGFTARLHRVDAEPIDWGESESSDSGDADGGFEPFGAGLRYEGDLALGWNLLLHADEHATLEVRVKIVDP